MPPSNNHRKMTDTQALIRAFDDFQSKTEGSLNKKSFGQVLQASGVKFNKAELLQMIDRLYGGDKQLVSREKFVSFFDRHKSMQHNSTKYNRMLLKATIGRSKNSSYDLPGDYHCFGNKLKRDPEGAGEVITTWAGFQPTSKYKKKLNVVKMNKIAVTKGGMTNVKDINNYNKTHKIQQLTGSKSRKEMLENYSRNPALKEKIYGVTREKDTPIRDLINATESDYPLNTAKDNRARRKANAKKFDRMKPTKASLGHATAARKKMEAQKQKGKKFKMKRFQDIPSKNDLGGGF